MLVPLVETPTARLTWVFVEKMHVAGIEKNTYVSQPPAIMLPTLIPTLVCMLKSSAGIDKKIMVDPSTPNLYIQVKPTKLGEKRRGKQ
jgi:hypothetical protein